MPRPEREVEVIKLQEFRWNVPDARRDLRKYLRSLGSLYLLSRAAHSLTFLADLGMRAGCLSRAETVGDMGFVHEISNIAQLHPWGSVPGGWELESRKARIVAQVERAALLVPGYAPSAIDRRQSA